MNIFETIKTVSERVEPYHSQFLADALRDSLERDRSLFEAFWKLAAPPHWEVPEYAQISSEEVVGPGRVDICVRCDHLHKRVVGIEVKTVDASAQPGQLERYRDGMERKFPEYSIQISYLTPFNRERAGDAANSLRAVQRFEEFAKVFPDARHLSWLDVADIPWDSSDLWKQHQEYVRRYISSPNKLEKQELNRGLADFFGEEATERFRDALADLGIRLSVNRTDINLSEHEDVPSFSRSLANAFKILLDTDNVSHNANRSDQFPDELRRPFLDSPYHEVHAALFGLAELFSYVWVQGKRDYGVRTAHKNHSSGVSLLRSSETDRIVVGERR